MKKPYIRCEEIEVNVDSIVELDDGVRQVVFQHNERKYQIRTKEDENLLDIAKSFIEDEGKEKEHKLRLFKTDAGKLTKNRDVNDLDNIILLTQEEYKELINKKNPAVRLEPQKLFGNVWELKKDKKLFKMILNAMNIVEKLLLLVSVYLTLWIISIFKNYYEFIIRYSDFILEKVLYRIGLSLNVLIIIVLVMIFIFLKDGIRRKYYSIYENKKSNFHMKYDEIYLV